MLIIAEFNAFVGVLCQHMHFIFGDIRTGVCVCVCVCLGLYSHMSEDSFGQSTKKLS